MNVLLLGAGGREHAFSWKLAQSKKLNKLFIAPGNAGTSDFGTNLNIAETDFEAIKKAVLEHNIQMLIVGPEAPLVKGIYDFFKKDEALKNIPVIGPSQYGAQLEGSKDFSKLLQKKN
jgi:phosphoribosylamine--glycine ligase